MMRLNLLFVGFAVVATACGSNTTEEPPVSSIPNCSRQEVIQSELSDEPGYSTPEEAAEVVRQAIIDGGGRPDGKAVPELLEFGYLSFYLPIVDTPARDGDGVIVVMANPGGGFLANRAMFCQGTIPQPFPWGLE